LTTWIAQTSPTLLESPFTTGAVFIALTGTIAYLYRARDQDHESEVERLERQIERLERQIDKQTDKQTDER
jgi:uncharacterized membrane protein YciS (DUF1049 family)